VGGTFSKFWGPVPVPTAETIFGLTELAIHPLGTKLYLPATGTGVLVLDAATGASDGVIATPAGAATGVCLATVSEAPTPLPSPPNDDITGAIVIRSLPYSNTQQTGAATTARDDPASCTPYGHTVWYEFTAPSRLRLEIDTSNSLYPTTVDAYTRSANGALTPVPCNTDTTAKLGFETVAGETYFIMVASNGDAPGGLLVLSAQTGLLVDVSITSSTVSNVDGTAMLAGTLTCSESAFVDLFIELRQRVAKGIADDTEVLVGLSCNGRTATPWTMKLGAVATPFTSGKATADIKANSIDPFGAFSVLFSTTLKL
jgi:hypothetical protein